MWLLFAIALAQDITPIPAGAEIHHDGGVTPVDVKSWLLPDASFREALAQAKELEIVKPALSECTDTTLSLTAKVQTVAKQCLTQFDGDQVRIDQMVKDIASMEQRALVAEGRLHEVKTQRTIAWSILGGVVLGAVTVVAVTLSP